MPQAIEQLFDANPSEWISGLPKYQRTIIQSLQANGASYDEIAWKWLTVSAENNQPFSAVVQTPNKGIFLKAIRREIHGLFCGDKKYEDVRSGLLGEKSVARTYVIATVAAAIAPHLGAAAATIAPVIALVFAGVGKVTMTALCETFAPDAEEDKPGPPLTS